MPVRLELSRPFLPHHQNSEPTTPVTALEVKETPVFQQTLVAFLREQGVPTEDLRRMAWQVLGKIWYRPRLLWRFLRNQPPPDGYGET